MSRRHLIARAVLPDDSPSKLHIVGIEVQERLGGGALLGPSVTIPAERIQAADVLGMFLQAAEAGLIQSRVVEVDDRSGGLVERWVPATGLQLRVAPRPILHTADPDGNGRRT